MKLKSLAVIILLVLGCSAGFAQGSATLGFLDYTDSFLYCNYEVIQWGGSGNFYMQGMDVLTPACGLPNNPIATVEGIKTTITKMDDSPVSGTVYAYADNIFDATYGSYTGYQWLVLTQTKSSRLLHHYGWVGYYGYEGYEFFGVYGYLSTSTPVANKSGKPVIGQSSAAAAKAALPVRSKVIQ